MSRREIAEKYFESGYNCAQSVALAFLDKTTIDKKTMLMLSSSFGGGMGRLREVCGAVSGMFIVLGLVSGYDDNSDLQKKAEHYKNIQKLAESFKAQTGSIVCRELLDLPNGKDNPTPEERTPAYYKKRPCKELVGIATQILDDFLK